MPQAVQVVVCQGQRGGRVVVHIVCQPDEEKEACSSSGSSSSSSSGKVERATARSMTKLFEQRLRSEAALLDVVL